MMQPVVQYQPVFQQPLGQRQKQMQMQQVVQYASGSPQKAQTQKQVQIVVPQGTI